MSKVLTTDPTTIEKRWIERAKTVLMNTYACHPLVAQNGQGTYLTDVTGKRYLDFTSGIAVTSLGHCDKDYVQSLNRQIEQLIHCSNLYLNMPAIQLAEQLVENSVFSRAFFCNSGTEAIEAALKLSRKYASSNKGADCTTILTMSNSFHGRTYGALSATAQVKYHNGYQPLVPGFETVTFNSIESLAGIDLQHVAAIIVEPIQGEGGVHLVDQIFLTKVRQICNEQNIVLIFDEIQCGVGRTGKFFAYENFAAEPDIVALAKGLGGGYPIGAILAKEHIASAFNPGDHGSTFGGNPVAGAAALTCLKKIKRPQFLEQVQECGVYLKNALLKLQASDLGVIDVRGLGLMLGVELDLPCKPIVQRCLQNQLLLVSSGETVIRFLPPLTVSNEEIDEAISIFTYALKESRSHLNGES